MMNIDKTNSTWINNASHGPSDTRAIIQPKNRLQIKALRAHLQQAAHNYANAMLNKKIDKPCATPMSMIYGFRGIRNLAREPGSVKFTVDLLNLALSVTPHQLSQDKLGEIEKGLVASERNLQKFAALTGMDQQAANDLLQSWSSYLKTEYDFISIKSLLKRKSRKYQKTLDYVAYTACKNFSLGSPVDPAILSAIKPVFREFLRHGDKMGFAAIARLPDSAIYYVAYIIITLFFRRTSKLALKWSYERNIPVIFDINFTPKEAYQSNPGQYQPITYSEYRFYKKHHFTHVTERPVHGDAKPAT